MISDAFIACHTWPFHPNQVISWLVWCNPLNSIRAINENEMIGKQIKIIVHNLLWLVLVLAVDSLLKRNSCYYFDSNWNGSEKRKKNKLLSNGRWLSWIFGYMLALLDFSSNSYQRMCERDNVVKEKIKQGEKKSLTDRVDIWPEHCKLLLDFNFRKWRHVCIARANVQKPTAEQINKLRKKSAQHWDWSRGNMLHVIKAQRKKNWTPCTYSHMNAVLWCFH